MIELSHLGCLLALHYLGIVKAPNVGISSTLRWAGQGVRRFEGPRTQSDVEPSELLELLLLELLLEPASDGNELPASPTMIC